ncbi:mandelate racemase/muconate lactonizing enzyme family protein [Halorubrum halodurans]|uniref:o-succinylbenzoate synthase n=1 Tax=Halorubrum halodurans TaxID=1383851 RepID=A0A256IRF6_9EURY|nr:enolase C-terminal domain-like protein [Halorubrum halodurans]OYR59139.1 o-succinylbenzoate synthase [Halorubrum halodurans]
MRVRPFSVALASPLRTAREELTDRAGFLVGVGTSDGEVDRDGGDGDTDDGDTDNVDAPATGIGEATPLPGWTESRSACAAALREAAANSGGPAAALDDLDADDAPAARHGLALALADAAAREADRSLSAHLADRTGLPEPADFVPVNATIGDGTPEATAADAERAAADGYRCLKVKAGARPLEIDLDRLRAVREAVGPAIDLRVDANGAWDRSTARRALDRLEPLDLAYVEQPLPAADLDATARLRAETAVPIALDESLAERSVGEVLAADAADALVIKPMALGGPDRALAAALRAREAGVEPVVTTTIDAVVARTTAVHVAGAVPDVAACGLATGGLLAEDLAPDPCPVDDGRVEVPDGPGIAGGAFDGLV